MTPGSEPDRMVKHERRTAIGLKSVRVSQVIGVCISLYTFTINWKMLQHGHRGREHRLRSAETRQE